VTSQSLLSTHLSADIFPLSIPHSKSSNAPSSRGHRSSTRRAAATALQLVHLEEIERGQPSRSLALPQAAGRAGQQPSAQRMDDAAGRLSASDTTARAAATAAGRSAVRTVTMLMIWSDRVCAHDAGGPARCGLLGCDGELGRVRTGSRHPC